MPAYFEITDDIKEIIKPYIKRGEKFKVSGDIEFNGKNYREVIIYKKGLMFFSDEVVGYIYISFDNSIVTSTNVLKELSKLGHYYEVFLSEDKKKGIVASLETKDDVESSRREMEDISSGLDFLRDEGLVGTDKVKYVVKTLPDIKAAMDRKTDELSEKIEKFKERSVAFSEDILKELYPIYEQILVTNFDNVKLISTIADVGDEIQVAAEKKRKKWKVRAKKNIVGKLMRVTDKIVYFKKVLRTYSNVVNMSSSQYLKFFKDLNKEKIETRFKLVRTIKS
jgi:hypothetical protein